MGTGKVTSTSSIFQYVVNSVCVIGKLILRGTRIVIPSKLRLNISALAHDGHLGVISTPAKLDPIN